MHIPEKQEELQQPPRPAPPPSDHQHDGEDDEEPIETLGHDTGPTPQQQYARQLKQAKRRLRGLLRMVKPGTRRWRRENEQMQCLCNPEKLVLFSNELQKVQKKITTLLRIRGYSVAQHPFRLPEGQRVP